MKTFRTAAALAALLFGALLAGCMDTPPSASDPAVSGGTSQPVVEAVVAIPQVRFRNGSFPETATLVSVALDADEIPLLDQLPLLATADLSGSTCYAEILAYAEAHPNVNVIYTVDVGGTRVSPTAESAVAAGPVDVGVLKEAVSYLPNLTSLDVRACGFDTAALSELLAALPDVAVGYTVNYGGAVYDSDLATLDLSSRSAAEVMGMTGLMDLLPNLTYVNLTNRDKATGDVRCDITLEQLATLQQRYPNTGFDYVFTLFDRRFSTADAVMDLKDVNVGKDRVDEVRAWLPYMTVCEMVDMDGCNVPNEIMAQLRDDFPHTKVVWRVKFSRYYCRTDAKVLRASTANPKCTTAELSVLQYCTELEMLDLGHNDIRTIDFVANMPNLRVAILAMGYVKDLTPLLNCPHMEYLEIFTNFISDVSPLMELKELKHLNIAQNRITDISPLYGMTQLERLWCGRNDIPQAQLDALKEALPNTEIDHERRNPTGGTWRQGERYTLLCEQFHYDMLADFVFE